MATFMFPKQKRNDLPLYHPDQLDDFCEVAKLVLAPYIPDGEEIQLFLGLDPLFGRAGLTSLGVTWMAEKGQWHILSIITYLSDVTDYQHDMQSGMLTFHHQPMTAHDHIERRSEMAAICAKREVDWNIISKIDDAVLTQYRPVAA